MARRVVDRAPWRPALQLIFVHIPKTGGSALREALFRARPWAANLGDYGPAHPATSLLVNELRYGPGGSLARLGAALESVPAFSLCGHIKAKPYIGVFGASRLITILRDPVERVISNYRHMLRRRQFVGSLVEFARLPQERNVQARCVGVVPLKRWLFVARQERLAADVRDLSRLVDAEIRLERVNQAPCGPEPEIDSHQRRIILGLNELDAELYETVRRPDPRIAHPPSDGRHESDMQSV